ncbi:MAG: SDR family oxidoreductase [Lachnospiraceae bacterium]|nr:SDR family oxidoreductase [Lachnospiraceae bacterium]
MLLKGKNAIITGSNRGIGRATLITFAKEGANVFAHARKETEEFRELCSALSQEHNVCIEPVYFDMTDEEAMKNGVKEVLSKNKNIDILVNNAGAVNQVRLFQMTSIEEMKDEFDINFFAQIQLTQMISKVMMRRKKGSIVNISSCAGLDGNTGMLEYVSSKAAMIGATKRLAIELGNYNIRVNSVAPGLTDTEMGNIMNPEMQEENYKKLVIKRKAKPSEVADAVLFFASDMSTFITGQTLRVDGGMLN